MQQIIHTRRPSQLFICFFFSLFCLLSFDLIFFIVFHKSVQRGTSKPWSDLRLWKVFLFSLSVSRRITAIFEFLSTFFFSITQHEPVRTILQKKRKRLLDVSGEPETYFLQSGWKITRWSFEVDLAAAENPSIANQLGPRPRQFPVLVLFQALKRRRLISLHK